MTPAPANARAASLFTPVQWTAFAAALLVLAVVLPVCNAAFPPGHALHISNFTINLYGKYATLAILALGIDLLWGFTGILSLGQALFFALGGYAMGIYLILMIGKLGQYKSDLPDFMVFLGYEKLPAHWLPFYSFTFALIMALAIPGLLAWIFGYLAFRSRMKGVYFSILTQALTYAAALMFFRNDFGFGGNNGLTDFKKILGFDINAPATRRGLYIASILTLAGVFYFFRWLTRTKAGQILQAVRDGENRVRFSGYDTARYKLFVFVLAAMTSGLGGALYVGQVGIINPSEMTPDKSLEAVVWVAVGGRGTLLGPIIGAVGVNALKSWATRAAPELWLFIMAALFIVVVLLLPGGIVSIPSRIKKRLKG
ncbi:urea ABC transporter permease subunit UrtC [Opitutaceae bacterium TAV4]|uniref:urea ABC transporter permease subunit UrtC n=1 Tax=Geminisphaera colitermitum TaxID=1148786 RepID=UPI0005BD394D|nr:urea ABC transporter permease subunit UrtC [Geminisphaera colitermitum]RRJ95765.1 urea ABC transporter permease subunit UrtC [Opitutaceae bacterium TAV4]RRJ99242.1 urea ABC transporter permease subunit UrtC [Opitutaceae bacterium TAV3]